MCGDAGFAGQFAGSRSPCGRAVAATLLTIASLSNHLALAKARDLFRREAELRLVERIAVAAQHRRRRLGSVWFAIQADRRGENSHAAEFGMVDLAQRAP